jgi:hypothetical protein
MSDNNLSEDKNLRFIDDEYYNIRREMTAWFQRMTLTYSFVFLVNATLIGIQLRIAESQHNFKILLLMIFTTLILLFTCGSAKLMARTYSIIFRQGSYLRVYYGSKTWINRNRSFWKYHDEHHTPLELRWIKSYSEVRMLMPILGAFVATSAIIIVVEVYNSNNIRILLHNMIVYKLCFMIMLLSLGFCLLWLYRLWKTNDHPKLWEKGWDEFKKIESKS